MLQHNGAPHACEIRSHIPSYWIVLHAVVLLLDCKLTACNHYERICTDIKSAKATTPCAHAHTSCTSVNAKRTGIHATSPNYDPQDLQVLVVKGPFWSCPQLMANNRAISGCPVTSLHDFNSKHGTPSNRTQQFINIYKFLVCANNPALWWTRCNFYLCCHLWHCLSNYKGMVTGHWENFGLCAFFRYMESLETLDHSILLNVSIILNHSIF